MSHRMHRREQARDDIAAEIRKPDLDRDRIRELLDVLEVSAGAYPLPPDHGVNERLYVDMVAVTPHDTTTAMEHARAVMRALGPDPHPHAQYDFFNDYFRLGDEGGDPEVYVEARAEGLPSHLAHARAMAAGPRT